MKEEAAGGQADLEAKGKGKPKLEPGRIQIWLWFLLIPLATLAVIVWVIFFAMSELDDPVARESAGVVETEAPD